MFKILFEKKRVKLCIKAKSSSFAILIKINSTIGYRTQQQVLGKTKNDESDTAGLASNNNLNELLSGVIICLLFKLINFCFHFSSEPLQSFLILPIAYSITWRDTNDYYATSIQQPRHFFFFFWITNNHIIMYHWKVNIRLWDKNQHHVLNASGL